MTKSLFLYHSVLVFNKIEEAVSRGIGMSGFLALGKEIGEGHASFNIGLFEEGYEEFLVAAICETALDLVEAMSGTCGYHKLNHIVLRRLVSCCKALPMASGSNAKTWTSSGARKRRKS
ncbi:hypothetical protein THAOC_08077 [Thalassiosira oceanica]|uniref:Uncharacterized protein n=1 Tax=Thalassiosira oceanica TaxID=159749 RepID=K0TJ06_THAOC|nr:hypothetical protein THAOC_08077 [Thalassiosira oceanica]|eukprot:EJK70552.1 hypothetical protein THAOC_08077 [Thalassiosira oceanica]